MLKKIFSFIKSIIILPVLISTLVSQAGSFQSSNLAEQKARVEAMRGGDVPICNEQKFASFDLENNDLKLNEVRVLATHNSYKKDTYPVVYDTLTGFLGENGCKKYHYEHDTLVSQLQNGIRSFEIDLRYVRGEFRIMHMPFFDMSTHCADFPLTLEELSLWSKANPDHLPITILFEIKIDTVIVSPNVKKMLSALDTVLLSSLGRENIITPEDLMGNSDTLTQMSSTSSWPMLNSLKGKFIFILHANPIFTPTYIGMDDTMRTQMMVPCIRESSSKEMFEKYAAFVMENDPKKEIISEWVNDGLIVRTRMDTNFTYSPERKEKAIACGAQILTTDLEKGVILPKTDYVATLKDNYTIIEM